MELCDKVILLVDDNSSDDILAKWVLYKHLWHNLIVIRDGGEALDYLFGTGYYHGRDVTDCPLLVVLDLELTEGSCLEVLRRIKGDERTSYVPVVVCSSSPVEQSLHDIYSSCANIHIHKQIDSTQFADEIKQVMYHLFGVNQPPPQPLLVQ